MKFELPVTEIKKEASKNGVLTQSVIDMGNEVTVTTATVGTEYTISKQVPAGPGPDSGLSDLGATSNYWYRSICGCHRYCCYGNEAREQQRTPVFFWFATTKPKIFFLLSMFHVHLFAVVV